MRFVGRLLVMVMLLLPALSRADAQPDESSTPLAPETTEVVDTSEGWSLAPRFRGDHAAATTTFAWLTCGISIDADLFSNSGAPLPLAFGIRAGYESGGSMGGTDWSSGFGAIDLLARFTLGGSRVEITAYGGYTRLSKGSVDFAGTYREGVRMLPKIGGELRWMFVPKYAGVLARLSVTETLTTGGIGVVVGWEP